MSADVWLVFAETTYGVEVSMHNKSSLATRLPGEILAIMFLSLDAEICGNISSRIFKKLVWVLNFKYWGLSGDLKMEFVRRTPGNKKREKTLSLPYRTLFDSRRVRHSVGKWTDQNAGWSGCNVAN